MPKGRYLRIVVVDLFVLVLVSTPYLFWTFIRRGKVDWGRIVVWALIIAFSSVMSNIDYYEWRNRRDPRIK
jgi:hypothetical protein